MIKQVVKKEEKRRRYIRLLPYLGIIVILALLIFGYKMVDKNLQETETTFRLSDVDIKGIQLLTRNDVLTLCGAKKEKAQQFTVKPADVVRRLLKSPYVNAASAVRSLPSKLRIVVVERQPIAFIYGQGLNLIDDNGYLIPVPNNKQTLNLPVITGVQGPLGVIGLRTTSAWAMKAVEILDYVRFMESPLEELIAEINMKDKKSTCLTLIRGGAEVKLSTDNYHENLYILHHYMQRYLDWKELASIEYFDVRYKNQFIVKDKRKSAES